jgi:6,7-dimethyl-8-ribityllumazine synthase
METSVPTISAVLTPQLFHSHAEQHAFFREHFLLKGAEAAHACLDTLEKITALQRLLAQRNAEHDAQCRLTNIAA